MVEFAVILPLLLLIVFGIIDFGLLFYNDLRLTQAARDAVRYVSVGNDGDAGTVLQTAINQGISTTVVTSISPGAKGEPRTVTVTGTYTWLTPLPALFPGVGGSATFDASATMRRE